MTDSDETAADHSEEAEADYAEGMLAYDQFVQPAFREALERISERLPGEEPLRILDAGCGPGGVFPLFADVFGEEATVIAVDNSEPHLEVAREQVRRHDLEGTVSVERHDLSEGPRSKWETFDVLWFSNVLFFFEDPMAMLERYQELLHPRGVVAAFYGGWDRATFLPGHPHLEALIYQTRMTDLDRCPADWREREGASHPERMPAWLTAAGFQAVRHDVLPVTYRRDSSGGIEEDARSYLEQRLSEGIRESILAAGEEAGLSKSARERALGLLTPESDAYVLDQPGYYCHVPTLLTTAMLPAGNDGIA